MNTVLKLVAVVAMLAVIAWAGTATFVAWDKHVEHEHAIKHRPAPIGKLPLGGKLPL